MLIKLKINSVISPELHLSCSAGGSKLGGSCTCKQSTHLTDGIEVNLLIYYKLTIIVAHLLDIN